jgi:hypothetical protein
MGVELLRASEAARCLDVPTKARLELVQQRRIRYEMVDGIAHIPADALVTRCFATSGCPRCSAL